MALISCDECGKQVSEKAASCPNCGAPIQNETSNSCESNSCESNSCESNGSSFREKFIVFIIAASLFAAIPMCSGTREYDAPTSRSSNQSNTSGSSSNSSSYSAPREYTPPLEVISWKCDKEYSYVFVRGEVKNISSRSIENVMAVGEFRTKDGTLVKSEDSLIDYNPILPGQTSPFKTGGTDNPAITKCNLSFKTLFGHQLDYTTAKDRKKKERKKIKEVQTLLSELGYKVGAVDGIMGAKTKQAIKEFQSKQGLTASGKISNKLVTELRRANK